MTGISWDFVKSNAGRASTPCCYPAVKTNKGKNHESLVSRPSWFLFRRYYGVGVIVEGVGVAVTPGAGVFVTAPGCKVSVSVGTPVPEVVTGQDCKSTTSSLQSVPPFAHRVMVNDVFSGARQSTTCLSLNVSTVLQPESVSELESDAENSMTSKVVVSGITRSACAIVSTQN